MTTGEAIKVLEWHNVWRQGADGMPVDPKTLTAAIEKAIEVMKLTVKNEMK